MAATRDPRTGRFIPRRGVTPTSTSVVPKDPGWRYGGTNWRAGSSGQVSSGQAARAARGAAARAPGTSVVPRGSVAPRVSPRGFEFGRAAAARTPAGALGPGYTGSTSVVPRSAYWRNAGQAAGRAAGGRFGVAATPTLGQTAGRLAGRAVAPISAAMLGAQLGGAVGTAAYRNSDGYRGMIENLAGSGIGDAVGGLGAILSGNWGEIGGQDTPTNYTSQEDFDQQMRAIRRQQTQEAREGHPELTDGPQSARSLMADSARYRGQAEAYQQEQAAQQQSDPFAEFLQSQMEELSGAYDAQIGELGNLSNLYGDQAAEAQGNIGEFFGYAGDVAREGIPVNQDIYGTAQDNVGTIYDDLGERLEGMPQGLTDIAREAAGENVGSSVAGRVAAATAPFAAAGESARANTQGNLEQASAAGQSYLNNLASATGSESALHQSAVEQALNQQQQLVAYRQAELEGAKQRAMTEVASDIAGSSSEQMANMALSQALGLNDLPGNVDPLDYLRGQGMMQEDAVDPIQQRRDLVGLQQAELNLTQDMNPNFRNDQIQQNLSVPARQLLPDMIATAEREVLEQTMPGQEPAQEDYMRSLLGMLDELSEAGELRSGFTNSSLTSEDEVYNELQAAIRNLSF